MGNATFGEGTGRIWLANIQCTGSETWLTNCTVNSDGVNSCTHNQDAGVRCPSGIKPKIKTNGPELHVNQAIKIQVATMEMSG